MKTKLLLATASIACLGMATSASAQDDAGWYLRGNAGYGVHTDVDIIESLNGDVESEGNVTGSLGLGYDFGNNWRLELDGNSLWTDMGAIGQQEESFAKLRTNSVMLNAIYDFEDFGRWEPYVGAGLGLMQAKFDAEAHDFINAAGGLQANPACIVVGSVGNTCEVHDKDSGFGWQLLAGLGYQISDNLMWDTNYKYQQALSPFDFDGVSRSGTAGTANPLHLLKLNDVGSHSLMTGFRYLFGERKATPPPPPPPPPAPVADYKCWDGSMVFNAGQCPAEPAPQPTVSCWDGSVVFSAGECPAQPQTYTCWDGSLVYDQAQCPAQISQRGNDIGALCSEQYRQEIIYYEFDKGQSAETRNTINRILDIGQYCNVDNIRVVGHTDTSGSAAYNLNLSKRRAKDARDELVRQGIAGERITSEGKGETEPFVPTGDGVKEQLNRRTEVLISLGSVGVVN